MSEATTQKPNGYSAAQAAKGLRYFSYSLYVVALLSCVALAFTGFDAFRMTMFGATGQATVLDLRTDTYRTVRTYGGGGSSVVDTSLRTDYYVTYTFEADGQKHLQERRVTESFYNSLTKGKLIAVRYLPGSIEENQIDREWVSWSIIVPALMAIFFFGCGYLFQRVARLAAQNAQAGGGAR